MNAGPVLLFDQATKSTETVLTPVEYDDGVAHWRRSAMTDAARRGIRGCTRVIADAAFRWFYDAIEEDWDVLGSRFGPVRLPFPSMWVEGAVPALYSENGAMVASQIERAAVICSSDTDGNLIIQPWVRLRAPEPTSPVAFPAPMRITLDQGGRVQLRDPRGFRTAFAPTDEGGRWLDHNVEKLWFVMVPALLALSLMNCKNVQLEHVSPQPKVTKKQRRPRKPGLDYHVIKLPQPRRTGVASKADAMGGAAPLHMVRGHFKTYTEDAPLLGQHIGTYWWSWQARGKAENGIRVADYEVGQPVSHGQRGPV